MGRRIHLYSKFERFWHWSQALLIITMGVTGFEIHGAYHLVGFKAAVDFHTTAAWALIALWIFAIFWHLTTGAWKQYVPTREKLLSVAKFYAVGVFRGKPHPYERTTHRKLNPLQRLAYLAFKLVMAPMLWITGLLYMFYNEWPAWGLAAYLDLATVALVHVTGAILIATFLVVHVYMGTLGATPWEHFKSMLTGWEEVHSRDDGAEPSA
ncbi:MAG: cytochrome b/b6 domain-containing protein [Magnetospirillum sp. WYHS-4]